MTHTYAHGMNDEFVEMMVLPTNVVAERAYQGLAMDF